MSALRRQTMEDTRLHGLSEKTKVAMRVTRERVLSRDVDGNATVTGITISGNGASFIVLQGAERRANTTGGDARRQK